MTTDPLTELEEAAKAEDYWVEGVGTISSALVNTMTLKKRTVLKMVTLIRAQREALENTTASGPRQANLHAEADRCYCAFMERDAIQQRE